MEDETVGPNLPLWVKILGLSAIVTGFGFRLYWSLILPFNDAPDEYCHYAMVHYIRTEAALPTMAEVPTRIPVSYPALPPLGYLPCAVTLAFVDPRAPGAFYFARLGNVLVGTATLVAALWAGLWMFPRRPEIGIVTTWAMALHPQLVFLNAYVNNDSSMVLGCTVLWWLWSKVARVGLGTFLSTTIGAIAGLTMLTKTNAMPGVLAGIPIIWHELTQRRWRPTLILGLTAGAVCVPWIWWSSVHHHSWSGVEIHRQWWFEHLAKQGIVQGFLNSSNAGEFALGTWQSYWGVFGYCSTFLKEWQYELITMVMGIAVGSVISQWKHVLRATGLTDGSRQRGLFLGLAIGLTLSIAAHVLHSAKFGLSAQGRYLFAAEWLIQLILSAGFVLLFRRRLLLGPLLLGLFCIWLQAESIDAEKGSNRVRMPDRRVRCRLQSFAGPVPYERGQCIAEQLESKQSTVATDYGIAKWRGDGSAWLLGMLKSTDSSPRYVHLQLRPVSGFGNRWTLAVAQGGVEERFPFTLNALGLCEYRFDLQRAGIDLKQPCTFRLEVEGDAFEVDVHRWEIR